MRFEIMDTTLRDGEQTSGVSFSPAEKLHIARVLLEEIKVDRIEVGSAKVSEGEFDSVCRIVRWAEEAGFAEKVEVLGFVDKTESIDWISSAGAKVINVLSKGSLKHLSGQLRKSPEQHFDDIARIAANAADKGMHVNLYLEDWSNGMKDSRDYVIDMIGSLANSGIKRFMLADTLGILNHEQTFMYCSEMVKYFPEVHFDFHAHNDYDLATSNVFAALKAGVRGIHTTVNGLGERAGNVSLSSVAGIIRDHLHLEHPFAEEKLTSVSRLVESYSGIRIPSNKPLIGENVFTQTCGVHADGDSKASLYFNNLMPERFGRSRTYALGKTSGKANIRKNIEELGLSLDEETMTKVLGRVTELGDKKELITKEDLPYIISDVLGNGIKEHKVRVVTYSLSLTSGLRPVANIAVEIQDQIFEDSAIGDGQYDAFMKALGKIYKSLDMKLPELVDYVVTIPPGGKTDALVDTLITWNYEGREFKTRALEADQTESAIKATTKMLNIVEQFSKQYNNEI